jgi:hypothetical protein
MVDIEAVHINYTEKDLRQHYRFLVNRELRLSYRHARPLPYVLVAFAIFLMILYVLPASPTILGLKAAFTILTPLVWLLGFIVLLAYLNLRRKRLAYINRGLKEFLKESSTITLSFNGEKINLRSDKFNTELNWEYFQFYIATDQCLYLYAPSYGLYEPYILTAQSLGTECFEKLKVIVKQKLRQVD